MAGRAGAMGAPRGRADSGLQLGGSPAMVDTGAAATRICSNSLRLKEPRLQEESLQPSCSQHSHGGGRPLLAVLHSPLPHARLEFPTPPSSMLGPRCWDGLENTWMGLDKLHGTKGTSLWAQAQEVRWGLPGGSDLWSWRNGKNKQNNRKVEGLNFRPIPSWLCDPGQVASPL